MKTEQEQFWSGEFGRDYIGRNRINYAQRIPFWREVLDLTEAQSILEVGSNIGNNLKAIRCIDRELELKGIDISYDACVEAVLAGLDVEEMSAVEAGSTWPRHFDLTLTCGVLIHVSDKHLPTVMNSIIASSKRYVLAVEYESLDTEMVVYRDHAERLWRRPFGRLYADRGLQLVKYWPDVGEGFDKCAGWLFEVPV